MTPVPFRVVLITDWATEGLLERLDAALRGVRGVAVQHRHPGATDRQLFEEGRALAEVCARHGAPLFVNGRLDLALAFEAHLHLPVRALAVEDVRARLPAGRLVSVAVHGPTERQDGADLALVAPVFPPGSKPDDTRPPLGPDGFSALAATLDCPAFALGGLTPQRARLLKGAAGVGVIGHVWRSADPRAALAELVDATVG